MSNISESKKLAEQKHAHLHLYDANRSPAIHHIAEVATWTEKFGGTPDMIAAAWLHDIVEDTDITIDDINKIFGDNIGKIVDGLTDPDEFSSLKLSERKSKQADRLKRKDRTVKIIKICDQLSNVLRVTNDPPTDWDNAKKIEYIEVQ